MPPGLLPGRIRAPAAPRVGQDDAVPQGAGVAPVPACSSARSTSRSTGTAAARAPTRRRCRASPRTRALRQADGGPRQPHAPQAAPSRRSTSSAVIDHVHPAACGTPPRPGSGACQLPIFDHPRASVPPRSRASAAATSTSRSAATELLGRWSISSDRVAWALDTTARWLNDLEQLVWRVVSGLKHLVGGRAGQRNDHAPRSSRSRATSTTPSPSGSRRSSARRWPRPRGWCAPRWTASWRDKVEPVKQQIAAVQAEASSVSARSGSELDQVEQQLQAELKRLTAGLVPGIKLPKIGL